jgi:hypothetical protein
MQRVNFIRGDLLEMVGLEMELLLPVQYLFKLLEQIGIMLPVQGLLPLL